MKLTSLLAFALVTCLLSPHTYGQSPTASLKNSTWKLFVPELSDTITLHIKNDSSFVTTSSGDVVVRSVCKVSGDTILMTDYDGQYACPNATGKYQISMSDDHNVMTMILIDDTCDGRANSINKAKWTRGAPPANGQK